MRGFLLESVGGVPRLTDLPVPTSPGPNLVVPVLAAGLNPVDLKMAGDPAIDVPRVVGNEAVVELDGVRAYAERTVVPHGSCAEQAVVDPERTIALPREVSDEEALAVGIAGLAAWVSLESSAGLQAGETVVVLGATGAVGRIAVQVARLLGAGRVVAAARDTERLAELRKLGADATVVLRDSEHDAAALQAATGAGADVVLDPVFGRPLLAALRATRRGARVVSIGASAGGVAEVPFAALRGRSMLTYSNQLTPAETKRLAYEQLLAHVAAGRIQVNTEVAPLERAGEAWQRQAAGPGTKLVLRP
jgi:NADPH:quinone reductase-like Zn-dependent oxidoreductase